MDEEFCNSFFFEQIPWRSKLLGIVMIDALGSSRPFEQPSHILRGLDCQAFARLYPRMILGCTLEWCPLPKLKTRNQPETPNTKPTFLAGMHCIRTSAASRGRDDIQVTYLPAEFSSSVFSYCLPQLRQFKT